MNDGTPYEGKLSRTVWSGGKFGDNLKELPITIQKNMDSVGNNKRHRRLHSLHNSAV